MRTRSSPLITSAQVARRPSMLGRRAQRALDLTRGGAIANSGLVAGAGEVVDRQASRQPRPARAAPSRSESRFHLWRSRRSSLRQRWVITPGIRRSVRVFTSGAAGRPSSRRSGAWPLGLRGPPRRRRRKRRQGRWRRASERGGRPGRRRGASAAALPCSSRWRISSTVTPASSSCARVTTPCCSVAIRAIVSSTVLSWWAIATPRQDSAAIRPPGRLAPVAGEAITQRSGLALGRAIRAGELSSREVVEAHIELLRRLEPALGAIAVDRYDAALEEADAADARIAAADDGEELPPLPGRARARSRSRSGSRACPTPPGWWPAGARWPPSRRPPPAACWTWARSRWG